MGETSRLFKICLLCIGAVFAPIFIWKFYEDYYLRGIPIDKLGAVIGVLATVTLFSMGMIFVGVERRKSRIFAERKLNGLCVHCGYDLRSNGGKCPECGKWSVRPNKKAP